MTAKGFFKMLIPPLLVRAYKMARAALSENGEVGNKDFETYFQGYDLNLVNRPATRQDASWFIEQFVEYKNQARDFPITQIQPYFTDRSSASGTATGHYFHQDLLVAQMIFESRPKKHVDIGSRVDGLIAHVASFREIEVFDIRPQDVSIRNVRFVTVDMMDEENVPTAYCDSASSLHAIEHFGLGRYGDPIDADGHVKAIRNIHKLLGPRGIFYFSVPIGPQRTEFNAHRVFKAGYLFNLIDPWFSIENISIVDDLGRLRTNLESTDPALEKCNFGCAVLKLMKK